MVSFTKQWEELLKKEKRKVEEKLQELKKQDIVVEEIEKETKTQDIVVEEEIKISSELIDYSNGKMHDNLNIITEKNKNIDVLELVEIVENEKAPPNEEEKENNKEQFRKSYLYLDYYVKNKLITGNTAYIYNHILNDYTVKKDYAKRYKKAIPKFYGFEFKKVIEDLGFNFRTLKKALEELENVGLLEIKKVNKFIINITFKKPISRE